MNKNAIDIVVSIHKAQVVNSACCTANVHQYSRMRNEICCIQHEHVVRIINSTS